MKKTHFIDLIKNIKTNFVSFAAITIFVSLGISLFCGLSWIRYSTNGYLDDVFHEGNVHTLELSFPLGIDQDGITQLTAVDGVEAAQGIRSINGCFTLRDVQYQANIRQLTNVVDSPVFVEGRLPSKKGEIAVTSDWANKTGVKIGDTITFSKLYDGGAPLLANILSFSLGSIYDYTAPDTGAASEFACLKTVTFKVTALLENPAYFQGGATSYGISPESRLPINCIMFISEESFATEAFPGYTSVVLTGTETRGLYSFSDEYRSAEERLKAAVEGRAQELASKQYDRITRKVEQMEDRLGVSPLSLEKEPECSIITRSQLVSYTFTEGMNEVQLNSRLTLASLFIIVGLLVCYSALMRIISDQIVLIGTKKAIGIKQREIRLFYFGFSGISLLFGSIIGVLLGLFVVEPVILNVVGGAFAVSDLSIRFSYTEALVIIAIESGFILFATWLAVGKTLKRSAVSLLSNTQDNLTKTGFYEKTKAYKRLGLLSQIIVNNFFKDRRRVIGTVVGILGSTALIVTAFTYQRVITESYNAHYDRFYHFDTVAYCDSSENGAARRISRALDGEDIDNAAILSEQVYIKGKDGKALVAELFVPVDLSDYKALVTPAPAKGSSGNVYSGLWLSRAYQKEFGLEVGDELEFTNLDGETKKAAIDGFAEHYIMNVQCYMDRHTYAKLFGKSVSANACLIKSDGRALGEINELLRDTGADYMLEDYEQSTFAIFEQLGNLASTVEFVYVILAIAMSILVLLNLLTMFVNEKKKELLMLLAYGYPVKDAKRYIYSDTILLTVVGSVLGVIVGELFGNVAAASYENSSTIFNYALSWQPALIGVVIGAALTFIMSCISLRKIDKFRLIDINQ